MIAFLMGLQKGYTKYPCYLCLWDSRADKEHYLKKVWPARKEFTIGKYNVQWEPLVPPEKVLMPPLHIKLGLMKQFVKKLNTESAAFKYLQKMFPKLSPAKVKGGIFVGPQVRKVMKCEEFPKLLTDIELLAWESFCAVATGFLGNEKLDCYTVLVQNLLDSYHMMGCRMSLKLHYLHSHLDKFERNMGDHSDEHGERFHQDIKIHEERYQGRYNENMIGDYIWSLTRDNEFEYNRKSRRTTHF